MPVEANPEHQVRSLSRSRFKSQPLNVLGPQCLLWALVFAILNFDVYI